jgi:hypothetical protein
VEESQLAFAYAGSGEIGVTMAILPCIVRSPFGWDAVDKAVCAVGVIGEQCSPDLQRCCQSRSFRMILATTLLYTVVREHR